MEQMNLMDMNEEGRKITIELAEDEHTYNLVTTTLVLRFGSYHKGKIFTIQKQQRQDQKNKPGVWYWNDKGKTKSLWQLAYEQFGLSLNSPFEKLPEEKQAALKKEMEKDPDNQKWEKQLKRPAYEQEAAWQIKLNTLKEILQ